MLFSASQPEESGRSDQSDESGADSSDSEYMLPMSDGEEYAASSDDDSVQFMDPHFCDCGHAHKRDCEFNPRNKHRAPPKLALPPSQDVVAASPVCTHVHDDLTITKTDPAPLVDFSLSPSILWKEEAVKFIEKMSGMCISPIAEDNYIIPCEEVLPHLCDRIWGDGNCLFRALSKEITGSQLHHYAVWLAIVNFIQCYEHPPALSKYLVKDYEKQPMLTSPALCQAACREYVSKKKMSEPREWGTDCEIIAAASMFQTHIVISAMHGRQRKWCTYRPLFQDSTCMPKNYGVCSLYLFHSRDHYNRIVPNVASDVISC